MPWTYGLHTVEALLEQEPDQVMEIWILKSRRPGAGRRRVRELAETHSVRYRLVDERQLTGAVGEVVHQGVAARVMEFNYASEADLLAAPGPGYIVVLDEVQDPHNLGAVLRTAAALGSRGVVIPQHRSATVTAAVRKVAAGAARTVPVCRVTNLSNFLSAAKDAGYWAYGAVVDGGERLDGTQLADRAVLVMGSERRGIRPLVQSHCDVPVTIPIGDIESLNVSVAAGIMMYEYRRQFPTSPAQSAHHGE